MRTIVGIVAILSAFAGAASAQTSAPASRGFLSLNGGYQMSSDDFGERITFDEHAEQGAFDTSYVVDAGPAWDVAGGATVWRQLGVAVGVTRFRRATPAAVSASVPHPFFFSRPRSVGGDVAGVTRDELTVHLQARALVPVGSRVQVMVFGGPSFFRIRQDLVNDFTYGEEYPYDSATFTGGMSSTVKQSDTGFNAGGDVAFFFTRQLGIGVTAQYAGATMELPAAGGGTIEVRAGGVQTGVGLRLRF